MIQGVFAKTFEGVIWSALGRLAQVALGLASVAVIARVLTPEVYGIFGAAMLLVTLAETVSGGSLAQCLVQRRHLSQAHIDTTFWLCLAAGILVAALLASLSVPLLAMVNAPQAHAALLCLAGMIVLNALAAVPQALLMREMNFRRATQIDTVACALSAISGIALALGGAGIWALILAEGVRVSVRTCLLCQTRGWMPSGFATAEALRELGRYNLSSLATVGLARADRMLPRLLVATMLGPQVLGIWLLARRILDEVQQLSSIPLNAVTLTTIARVQHEAGRVRQVVGGLYQASAMFSLPCHAGAIVLLPMVLPIALGPQWHDAVLPAQILLLLGVRSCTSVFDTSILRGLGHVGLPLIIIGLGMLSNAAFIPLFADYGIAGIAVAFVLRHLLTWPLGTLFIGRAIGLSAGAQLAPMRGPLLSASLMALTVYLALPRLLASLGEAGGIAAAIAIGAILYLAALLATTPALGRRVRGLAGAIRDRDHARIGSLLGELPAT
ncbi:MAG: oligosaccharide flippase family protein [Burkholderiaceae bacterium]